MAQKAQEKKKKSKISTFFYVLVCAVIIGAFARLIIFQADNYNEQRAQHEAILADLARARTEYYALRYQIANIDSDAYIERLARDRLGWARPNEIVFRQRMD